MDKEKAKEFIFQDEDSRKIYISKDLQMLLDKSEGELFWIYAVVETESGETLMQMDFAYSGEPIIMRRYIHKDFFMKEYEHYEIIKL